MILAVVLPEIRAIIPSEGLLLKDDLHRNDTMGPDAFPQS